MTQLSSKLSLAAAIALAVASLAAPLAAQAEEKKPDNEVTANASLTSDYRYRGISQSRTHPALQGGVDYTNNPTGIYLGAWGSTIKWVEDSGGGGQTEVDLYGGVRGDLPNGFNYDVGVLGYVYSNNGLHPSANTTEVYGQIGFGPAYFKYSQSTTNLFGAANSKGSGYVDVGANIDVGSGITANLHVGHQNVKNNGILSYTDYKVGLTKDLGVCSLSAAIIGSDTDAYIGPSKRNLGRTSIVVAVSKTF